MRFEYLDEIKDLIEQPLYGTVETRDPAVDGVVTLHGRGTAYGQLSRRRRSQTEVVMSIEELSDYSSCCGSSRSPSTGSARPRARGGGAPSPSGRYAATSTRRRRHRRTTTRDALPRQPC